MNSADAVAEVRSTSPPVAAVGSRSHRDYRLRRLLALADCAGILVGLGAGTFFSAFSDPGREFLLSLATLPGWIVLFKLYGLYDRDEKRVSHSTVDDVPWIFHALVMGSLGLYAFLRVTEGDQLDLLHGIVLFGVSGVAVFLARAVARSVARVSTPPERILFVGGGPMTSLLIDKIRKHKEYGLEPIGYVGLGDADPDELDGELTNLGGVSQLEAICEQEGVDRVVVAAPSVDGETLSDVVRRMQGLNVRISIIPHVVDVLGPSVAIDDVEGITLLGLNPPALTRSSRLLKRAMDLTIAVTVLAVVLPLLLAITVLLKLGSPGPVLYSQVRVGRGGRRIRVHKFRTMVVNAEERAKELRALSAHPAWLLLDDDPRVTRIGRVLRRASLDELPQLWNVVTGDMSLVGPRPMPPEVYEHIRGWSRRRLDLTPGITGLWQVLGRTEIPFEEMLKLDYLYVTNWSLWQDVRLLIRTLPAIMRARGAQ